MAKRTPGLEQVNLIIPKSIHAMGSHVEKLYRRHFVLWHWRDIVGEAIASNVRPMGIEHGRLWLYTADSSWRNEIQMMQTDILQKVNGYAGERLVTEMRFGRKWEKPAFTEDTREKENNKKTFKRVLLKMNLSEEEMEGLKRECLFVEDEQLRKKFFRLLLIQRKLTKWKIDQGWHTCLDCGALCPEESLRCSVCSSRYEEGIRERVRSVLRDLPWLRYGEIRKQVPESTPYMVNSIRASMVQQLAKTVELKEWESLAAKQLVMLHLCLPPEQLTEDILKQTVYRLRKDLSQSEEFHPVRRRDYITGRKAGRRHVSSSGEWHDHKAEGSGVHS